MSKQTWDDLINAQMEGLDAGDPDAMCCQPGEPTAVADHAKAEL